MLTHITTTASVHQALPADNSPPASEAPVMRDQVELVLQEGRLMDILDFNRCRAWLMSLDAASASPEDLDEISDITRTLAGVYDPEELDVEDATDLVRLQGWLEAIRWVLHRKDRGPDHLLRMP